MAPRSTPARNPSTRTRTLSLGHRNASRGHLHFAPSEDIRRRRWERPPSDTETALEAGGGGRRPVARRRSYGDHATRKRQAWPGRRAHLGGLGGSLSNAVSLLVRIPSLKNVRRWTAEVRRGRQTLQPGAPGLPAGRGPFPCPPAPTPCSHPWGPTAPPCPPSSRRPSSDHKDFPETPPCGNGFCREHCLTSQTQLPAAPSGRGCEDRGRLEADTHPEAGMPGVCVSARVPCP